MHLFLGIGLVFNNFMISKLFSKKVNSSSQLSVAETVQELDSNLQAAVDTMKNTDYPVTAVTSGCELFLRFITLAKLDTKVNSILRNLYRIIWL